MVVICTYLSQTRLSRHVMFKPEGSREEKKRKSRHWLHMLNVKEFGICVAALCVYVLITSSTVSAQGDTEWRKDYIGHGTTHEQLGQAHFPEAELTPFVSKATYSNPNDHSNWGARPMYNITQGIYKIVITGHLPTEYIQVVDGFKLALGNKVHTNDWAKMLSRHWVVFILVILLLVLILLMPFLAICYCCFCCCRRCRKGCPPCDTEKDKEQNLIYSGVLIFFIILLLIVTILAFCANRVFENNLDGNEDAARNTNNDICQFTREIDNHIQHLFLSNYEELEAHLTELLTNAHNHIFLDLSDTSESIAIEALERILNNMEEAKVLLNQVDKLEKELRFYGTQLRDAMRGVKRDVNFACSVLINFSKCSQFLKNTDFEYIDTSACLHFDNIPNTTDYINAIDEIIKSDYQMTAQTILFRYQDVGAKIETYMAQVVPSLVHRLQQNRASLQQEAAKLRNIVNSMVDNVHTMSDRSGNSFRDIYDSLGSNRKVFNILVLLILFCIIFLLILALIASCVFSKGAGANFLLITIIFIFITFSFITLVALFYFVIGVIAYQGACEPLKNVQESHMEWSSDELQDISITSTINYCLDDKSLVSLLRQKKIYSVENLKNINLNDASLSVDFDEDLSEVSLLTDDDSSMVEALIGNYLSNYHSILYIENMCKTLTPNLPNLVNSLYKIRDSIGQSSEWQAFESLGRVAMHNEAFQLEKFNSLWTNKIRTIMDKMKEKLQKVDDLILYENRNFGNSIRVLSDAISRSEQFIRSRGTKYINVLRANMTDAINEQMDNFINNLISECDSNVARCAPLSQIYYQRWSQVCYNLVDPMDGYWGGILLAALLLLPILFLAHELMCLWRRMQGYAVKVVVVPPEGGCPICTGAPYIPPPIVTCTGGQQGSCACGAGSLPRRPLNNITSYNVLPTAAAPRFVGSNTTNAFPMNAVAPPKSKAE